MKIFEFKGYEVGNGSGLVSVSMDGESRLLVRYGNGLVKRTSVIQSWSCSGSCVRVHTMNSTYEFVVASREARNDGFFVGIFADIKGRLHGSSVIASLYQQGADTYAAITDETGTCRRTSRVEAVIQDRSGTVIKTRNSTYVLS